MTETTTTPPKDDAAEQAVLGSMMLAAHVIPDVTARLAGRDYYLPQHEVIHEAITELWNRQQPVDPVAVAGLLSNRGQLERVGGAPYLHTLTAGVPSPASATFYADAVVGHALRRRLVEVAGAIRQRAHDAEDPVEAAEDARQLVDAATEHASNTEGGVTVGQGLDPALDWLESTPAGADTPWQDVNYRTNGLLSGQMVTVAARPGHGKSLVAKDVGVFTAKTGRAVHIATLEMSRNEYMARILAAEARVDLGTMLRREMTDSDWTRVAEASEKVRDLPLYLDDRESQSMAQIRASARQTARRYGELGLIAIDYCQLVRPAKRLSVREQEVAQISRDTKLLAKEFGCPVMLLAQLNRGNQQRSDRTPLVSDLRESGALEQDSDQVWLLHRPDQYPDGEHRMGEVDLIVGKNRNGPAPITVPLAFRGHNAQIASLA